MKEGEYLIPRGMFEFAESRDSEPSKASQTYVALASTEGDILQGLLLTVFVGKNGLIPRCVYVAITPTVQLGMMLSDLRGVQEEHLCRRL